MLPLYQHEPVNMRLSFIIIYVFFSETIGAKAWQTFTITSIILASPSSDCESSHRRHLFEFFYRFYYHPRLAAMAEVNKDMEPRARKEDAAADEKCLEILSAEVDNDPMSLTNFGDKEFAGNLAPTRCSRNALASVFYLWR